MIPLFDKCCDGRQRLLTVGYHSHIGLHTLVDLAMVDIQMNNLCLFGVGLRITRHTVAETHTDGNEYVAFLLFDVRRIVTMHTQHTHIQRMGGRKGRKTQHGTSCGNISFLEEQSELLLCITQLNTLSYKSQWFLCLTNQGSCLLHGFHIQFRISHIGTDGMNMLRFEFH